MCGTSVNPKTFCDSVIQSVHEIGSQMLSHSILRLCRLKTRAFQPAHGLDALGEPRKDAVLQAQDCLLCVTKA